MLFEPLLIVYPSQGSFSGTAAFTGITVAASQNKLVFAPLWAYLVAL
jgi:hypothetical protein